jgi:2-amino-4-hydroxy-6-hydroxymethyldihydropteridine diphosphokinase
VKKVLAYIGIGSNLGDALQNCRLAICAIRAEKRNHVAAVSPFYRTEPVGRKDQNWFVNAVAALETSLNPRDLLHLLQGVENEMGRVRQERWGPRVIDLDILFYGDRVLREEDLEIPHPRLHTRRFVLLPLGAIAPNLRHPLLNQTVSQLLSILPEEEEVLLLPKTDQGPCGESSLP